MPAAACAANLRNKQAEWAKQEPAAKAAATREAELSAKLLEADAVTKRIENRFYWAPVLDVLLKTVPPNVQIVNLTGNNDPKSDKISVLLEGIVAGDVPRIAADQFRTTLNDADGQAVPRRDEHLPRPGRHRLERQRRRPGAADGALHHRDDFHQTTRHRRRKLPRRSHAANVMKKPGTAERQRVGRL